jgi:hypothetical protein
MEAIKTVDQHIFLYIFYNGFGNNDISSVAQVLPGEVYGSMGHSYQSYLADFLVTLMMTRCEAYLQQIT